MLRHQYKKHLPDPERQKRMKRLGDLLNTPAGLELMAELESVWDPVVLFSPDAHDTTYNVGLRDAFKYLQHLQNLTFAPDTEDQ